MKYVIGALSALAALGLFALAFPYTGLYDVSAARGHSELEAWYLSTLSRRSIRARAEATPPDLGDSTRVVRGAFAYGQMCQSCHGGPGARPSVTGEGLSPRPPDLAQSAAAWSDPELFWILQHGIKMAGMPAYGPSHSDEELWELVAFVRSLQSLDSAGYAALAHPDTTASAVPPGHEGHDHVH